MTPSHDTVVRTTLNTRHTKTSNTKNSAPRSLDAGLAAAVPASVETSEGQMYMFVILAMDDNQSKALTPCNVNRGSYTFVGSNDFTKRIAKEQKVSLYNSIQHR